MVYLLLVKTAGDGGDEGKTNKGKESWSTQAQEAIHTNLRLILAPGSVRQYLFMLERKWGSYSKFKPEPISLYLSLSKKNAKLSKIKFLLLLSLSVWVAFM